jgi:hypothetical protein
MAWMDGADVAMFAGQILGICEANVSDFGGPQE